MTTLSAETFLHRRTKPIAPRSVFWRADTSRNRDTGGVGLGLSAARAIVREQGGELTLSNRSDAGLVARVELPRGRMGESARQVEGSFESLLAESFS